MNGGSDGARTRDLRRDRPTIYLVSSMAVPTFGAPERTAFRPKSERPSPLPESGSRWPAMPRSSPGSAAPGTAIPSTARPQAAISPLVHFRITSPGVGRRANAASSGRQLAVWGRENSKLRQSVGMTRVGSDGQAALRPAAGQAGPAILMAEGSCGVARARRHPKGAGQWRHPGRAGC